MSKISVLIADDVTELRALLKVHLKQFNCQVNKEVEDGSKVIAAIQQEKPDMVFLDINLPNRDGISILQELSENKICDNVWMITGETDEKIQELAKWYGAKGFIHKPFTAATLQHAVEQYKKSISDSNNSCSVIIADDEPLMRELLKNVLAKMNCNTLKEAGTGKEVIDSLRSGTPVDITFLDIEMPELNGLETLKIIKKEKIPTFTIIVSAHGTFENVQTAMNAGADGFIVKPYSEKKVEQLIAKFRKSK